MIITNDGRLTFRPHRRNQRTTAASLRLDSTLWLVMGLHISSVTVVVAMPSQVQVRFNSVKDTILAGACTRELFVHLVARPVLEVRTGRDV